MKNTRRAFSLSSFAFGAALAGSRPFSQNRLEDAPGTVAVHEDPKLSCFEINLARVGPSEVVATFGRAEPGLEVGDILLLRSNDAGQTWNNFRPLPIFSTEAERQGIGGYQHAALTRLNDGGLMASTTKFGFLFEGKVGWRRGSQTGGVFVRASADSGRSWGEIRKVDTTPFRRAWTRGPMVEMQDGTLLLPLSGQKNDDYNGFDEPIASFLVRSDDRGETWKYHAIVAQGSSDYDEPAMVNLGGQRLLCALRSHNAPRQDPPGGYIHMTISEDGGASWSQPRVTSMWGHPASLLRLADDRILCSYGYRMHPNPGVRACVSADGVSWQPGEIFTVNAQPDVESDQLQIGCPSSVELVPGRILTAYQAWVVGHEPEKPARQYLEGSSYRV